MGKQGRRSRAGGQGVSTLRLVTERVSGDDGLFTLPVLIFSIYDYTPRCPPSVPTPRPEGRPRATSGTGDAPAKTAGQDSEPLEHPYRHHHHRTSTDRDDIDSSQGPTQRGQQGPGQRRSGPRTGGPLSHAVCRRKVFRRAQDRRKTDRPRRRVRRRTVRTGSVGLWTKGETVSRGKSPSVGGLQCPKKGRRGVDVVLDHEERGQNRFG